MLLFAAFALAFAIKVPVFPLHTWLPDAHTEAPAVGSVLLAGVMLKMGTFGFIRYAMPLFPQAALAAAPLIALLGVVGIVYGSLMCMAQTDLKRMIAYSSVAHLGFVMTGLAALTAEAVSGAVLQMVNHGISTGALFLMIGYLYERTHTRKLADYGGLGKITPAIGTVFLVITLSSIGLPGTNGFIGEFLILLGTFISPVPWAKPLAVIGSTGVILGAAYMLYMYQKVILGPVTREENRSIPDLSGREWATLLPLLAAIVVLGVYPSPMLTAIKVPVEAFVARVGGAAGAPQRLRPVRAQVEGGFPGLPNPTVPFRAKPAGQPALH
jgi:NADH-quinone oxidoreductase subunit M